MKFSKAKHFLDDGVEQWAKLKGIDLEKDRTVDEWGVFLMIALQHIYRGT